jgi:hypothetical protein
MLDFAIWGDSFGCFQLTNVLLYLALIGAWFLMLVEFGVDRRMEGMALFIFAVHPVHAESVAWLAVRKGLLGMTFAGLAGFGYARFRAPCESRAAAIGRRTHRRGARLGAPRRPGNGQCTPPPARARPCCTAGQVHRRGSRRLRASLRARPTGLHDASIWRSPSWRSIASTRLAARRAL